MLGSFPREGGLSQVSGGAYALLAQSEHRRERLSQTWRGSLDGRIAEFEALRDRLSGCIGCGCLSLESCGLFNPGDRAAGAGAHYLFGEAPDPDPGGRQTP